jgi:accessory secretory protein Asp2
MVDDQSMNEQLYYYFDPGDFKPPLVVYFSGFRLALGVEGANMMRALEAPALIFGEQRILGGSFYVGSKKFEQEIVRIIQTTLKKLGFTANQLVLSGLSMGTYASLYYSSYLNPEWVVVGKPLTKLGDIAANERINRPDAFPTSLDVLLKLTGGISNENIEQANNIFWDSFRSHDHSKTNFVIAYMKEDDYDRNAFDDLYRYLHQNSPKSRIIHKGLTGRHNDDTNGIVEWFLMQIRNILTSKYGRNFKLGETTDDE